MKKTGRSGKERITSQKEEEGTVRKGPWTMEEDLILFNYILNHGEGLWNSVAKASGLKRTGKSCRLRWLNYLRPDVRRGNITAEEQLLIIQLQAKLGNKWSKIAKHLPGRTDNEIKNFWRTKIQRHMKLSSSKTMNSRHCLGSSQSSVMTTTDQGSSSNPNQLASSSAGGGSGGFAASVAGCLSLLYPFFLLPCLVSFSLFLASSIYFPLWFLSLLSGVAARW